jgi:1-acyl-sn-glycerol-3-phosphate acyltransferase
MSNESDAASAGSQSGMSVPGPVPLVYGPSRPIPFTPQRGANWVYFLACQYLMIYYLFAARVRVEGIENMPRKGGGIIVCNHGPGNDYFPLGISLPRMPHIMVKVEAYEWHPILAWILKTGQTIPVSRGSGDVEALRTAVRIVREGGIVAMFPEGHRSEDGQLQNGKTGATRIALDGNVPIIPVGVIGAEAGYDNFPRFWKRPVILVRIGKPFVLEGKNGQDRAAVVAGTRLIMLSIAELLPYEMRGIWADSAAPSTRSERVRAAAAATSAAAAATSDGVNFAPASHPSSETF